MEWMYGKGISIEAQVLYRKAIELEERGDHEAALACLGQAVLLSPCYARALFEMGNCLARMGKYDEAMEKYKKAVAAVPSGLNIADHPVRLEESGWPEQRR